MADIINLHDRKADRELAAIVDGIADLADRVQASVDAGLFVSASNDSADIVNTGVSSVAIARIGGEWVVSHFLCDTDGEPDYDQGEIQVTTCQSEAHARCLFRSISLFARAHIGRFRKMRRVRLGVGAR